MNKRITSLLTILMMLVVCPVVNAQLPTITNGLSFLTDTQNPDGSWGNDSTDTELLPSTVSVIETLQVLNQTGTSNYTNAVTWLQSQGLDLSDYLSGRIHALSIAGTDRDLLLSYIDELEYVWGVYDDFGVNNLDTALALIALKKVNYSDQNTIDNALSYLVSSQNSDGGWAFRQAQGDPSTGSGQGTSTVYETALAYLALVNETTDATVLGNAINYLTSTQLANGSWNDDPYSTALALRALANVKPNLSITSNDITFSNPTPTAGETITISANIKNSGPAQAPSTSSGQVTVQFYDGDTLAGGRISIG